MLFNIYAYIKKRKPRVKGFFYKLLMSNAKLTIGKNFKCDTWPEITLTEESTLSIGDNVYLRRNIELRAHKKSNLKIGSNCRIDRGVRLLTTNSSLLQIGKKTRVGLYSVLNGGDNIIIEENVLVSGFVYIQTSNHNTKQKTSIIESGYEHSPIFIGSDSWLAAHVVILPGIRIGEGAVVGSNAVVTKDVLPFTINGGIPSKILKER